jgi:hypothetical protein
MIKSKKDEMGGADSTDGRENTVNACKVLVRKSGGKRPLGRPRHSRKDHSKVME